MRKRFQDLLNIKKNNNLTKVNQQLHITFDIIKDKVLLAENLCNSFVRPSLVAVKKKKIQKKVQQKQSKKIFIQQNDSFQEHADSKIYKSITKDQPLLEAETTTCFGKQDQLTRRNSIKDYSNDFENKKLKSELKTIQIPVHQIICNEFQNQKNKNRNEQIVQFQHQLEINSKMRSILVKWLYQVSLSFKFKAESFFLAVHILDKYTQRTMIKRDEYQLIGITALFMAGKLEEIYPPKIRQYVALGQQSYNQEQMLHMEFLILQTLNFEINFKSTFSLLSLLKIVDKFDQKTMDTALFLANAGLMKSHACTQNYDIHAVGALHLACQLNNQQILFENLQSHHWFPNQEFVCAAKEFQTNLNLESCFKKFFSFMQTKPNYRSYLFKI